VFADKGDSVLLGARALEGLLLWVDPKNKKLIEIEAHPVAKVVVPGKVSPDKDKPLRTGMIIQGQGQEKTFLSEMALCPLFLESFLEVAFIGRPQAFGQTG
jgi:hypothetical protein